MAGGGETRSADWMRPPDDHDLEPERLDMSRPTVARTYGFALGSKDNFAVDRAAAEAVWRDFPPSNGGQLARATRTTLRRMVRHLVGELGVRQLVDIGSGLPTAGNVHEIAHEVEPATRVVYVDNDPIVLVHGRALLADNETTTVILGDVSDPDAIFEDPATRGHLDPDQPFAILLSAILHHLPDEADPVGVAHRMARHLPSGGYLLTINFLDDGHPHARALERAFLTHI